MLRESDIDNDDLREELEDINNKIMLNPNNADLYYEKTEILMYMEDYEAALESINNFIILAGI